MYILQVDLGLVLGTYVAAPRAIYIYIYIYNKSMKQKSLFFL
jgi:hypothetical protein